MFLIFVSIVKLKSSCFHCFAVDLARDIFAESLLVQILSVNIKHFIGRVIEPQRNILIHLEQRFTRQQDTRKRERMQTVLMQTSQFRADEAVER